jgi:integrase
VSIRQRGPRSYQVRVEPFPAKTFPTRASAKAHELELLTRRAQGDRYVDESRTLGAEVDGWLSRHRAMSGGAGEDRTTEFYERSARIWDAFRHTKLSALRRAPVEDFISVRASKHRKSAQNELEFLKRVLREARGRGQRFDEAVLSIPPIKAPPRQGWALTVDELYEFASWFPEHSRRLVLLAGMVGARQHVWFGMTDKMLDLQSGALSIPASLAKNRRDHRVYLTDLEIGLFREQLMVRAAGADLVFPTPTGKAWTRSGFRERVWVKAIEAAVTNGPTDGPSVYEGFTFHLLRHTACSLMALAGMDPAVASERASHTDGGALFLRKYRHLYEEEKRTQALRLEAMVRSHLDASRTTGDEHASSPLNEADEGDGRTWDRTRDLPRVKRALSR